MKTIILNILTAGILLLTTTLTYSQTTPLISTADLVILSTDDGAGDKLTGNVVNDTYNVMNDRGFIPKTSEIFGNYQSKKQQNNNEWEGYFSGYIDLLTLININSRNIVTFGGNISLGCQLNPHLYIGGGTSIYMYSYPTYTNDIIADFNNSYAVDIYGDLQLNFFKHTLITPFLGLKVGGQVVPYYELFTLCFRPSIGLSVRLPRRNELRLSVEYVPVRFFLNNCLSINLGYKFGSN